MPVFCVYARLPFDFVGGKKRADATFRYHCIKVFQESFMRENVSICALTFLYGDLFMYAYICVPMLK